MSKARLLAAFTSLLCLTACAAPLRAINVPEPGAEGFMPMLASLTSSQLARGRTAGFWYDPESIYAARIDAVKEAKQTIHFETYFMTPGKRATAFGKALAERAEAGVRVCFIADADGAKYMPKGYWQKLRAAGVEVRFYNHLNPAEPWTYNTRTHRKILTVDGRVALTGGTGVSDHWDPHDGAGPWADTEVRLEGPVVGTLEGIFAQHWLELGGESDLGAAVYGQGVREEHDGRMMVTASGPRDGTSPLRALYHTSMLAARKRLWIASPYFLPSIAEQRALVAARKKGVDVRVLSVGPRNDQAFTYMAVQEHALGMVAAGVPIYEYQPAMMHAKVMLVDDAWVVTGSANFDPRSFFHNDELTVAAHDRQLARGAEDFFDASFARSKRLTTEDLNCRNLWTCVQSRSILALWWWL